jgi:hypothetical protein
MGDRPILPGGVVGSVGGSRRGITLHAPIEPKHHAAMADAAVTIRLGDETAALTAEAAKSLAYRLLSAAGVDSPAARVNAPYPRAAS